MKRLDLKIEPKRLDHASARDVTEVLVPTMNCLVIDGEGDPNTFAAYASAVEALFMVK